MKNLLSFLTTFLFAAKLWSQVAIVPMPHQAGYLTLADVWRVNMINPLQKSALVVLEINLQDASSQDVLSGLSPAFLLLPGSNRPNFSTGNAAFEFGSNQTAGVLKNTGRLPFGNYILCYRLKDANLGTLLGEFCQEENIQPISPPELISPFDGESLSSFFPILTWKPPFPPSSTPIEYRLRLTEMKEQQTALEAVETNLPLLDRLVVGNTNLPYPGNAPRLEIDKKYAWQISARVGEFELGTTEAWSFEIEQTENRMPSNPEFYHELKLAPTGGVQECHVNLKFRFDDRFYSGVLNYLTNSQALYFIYPEGNRTNPIAGLPNISIQHPRTNKVSINLSAVPGGAFENGKKYLLVVRDVVGREYYLDFVYFNT